MYASFLKSRAPCPACGGRASYCAAYLGDFLQNHQACADSLACVSGEGHMDLSLDKLLADKENLERIVDSLMEGIIAHDKERKMATFKCSTCGHEKDGRCKPQKCPNCGGTKTFEKKS